ncbi:OsmC family peroxiredoxin [Falsiroseomonas bella]|uniref:OsmC family peroxiredoxin n=1 Tax=Falsiroseomonas bella TaxID=2184016 RepID=A0A317F8M2_9PROT|nr:OsmC family peroxiredoxin [Falsiroseomonas bella]
MRREGSALWQGSGKEGKGTLTTQSGTLSKTPYSFTARFGDGQGTNPEELIAAAHAGCFSMALAFQLSGAGHPPQELATTARLTMEQESGGWKIAAIVLVLKAKVPGIAKERFDELAAAAKANCPVSKVLNAAITLDATLEA